MEAGRNELQEKGEVLLFEPGAHLSSSFRHGVYLVYQDKELGYVLAMSKLLNFPNSLFRFSAFVIIIIKNLRYFLSFFCSVKIEAVRFIFESKTEELKQFVSLR
jgi:hypothetical protein